MLYVIHLFFISIVDKAHNLSDQDYLSIDSVKPSISLRNRFSYGSRLENQLAYMCDTVSRLYSDKYFKMTNSRFAEKQEAASCTTTKGFSRKEKNLIACRLENLSSCHGNNGAAGGIVEKTTESEFKI